MHKMKDGRVVFTAVEVRTLASVLRHGVVVVDIMEAEKNLQEDFAEVNLLKALHSCAEMGLTAETLTSNS